MFDFSVAQQAHQTDAAPPCINGNNEPFFYTFIAIYSLTKFPTDNIIGSRLFYLPKVQPFSSMALF